MDAHYVLVRNITLKNKKLYRALFHISLLLYPDQGKGHIEIEAGEKRADWITVWKLGFSLHSFCVCFWDMVDIYHLWHKCHKWYISLVLGLLYITVHNPKLFSIKICPNLVLKITYLIQTTHMFSVLCFHIINNQTNNHTPFKRVNLFRSAPAFSRYH